MDREDRVRPGGVEGAVGDHGLGAGRVLLGRPEEELDRAGQLLSYRRQGFEQAGGGFDAIELGWQTWEWIVFYIGLGSPWLR